MWVCIHVSDRQRTTFGSQPGLDSGLPLRLFALGHLPGSRFLRDCLFSRVAVLSYVPTHNAAGLEPRQYLCNIIFILTAWWMESGLHVAFPYLDN